MRAQRSGDLRSRVVWGGGGVSDDMGEVGSRAREEAGSSGEVVGVAGMVEGRGDDDSDMGDLSGVYEEGAGVLTGDGAGSSGSDMGMEWVAEGASDDDSESA